MQSNKLLSITIYSILSRLNVFAIFIIGLVHLKQEFKWKTLILAGISFFGISLVICPYVYGLDTDTSSKGLEFNWTVSEILGLLTVTCHLIANGLGRTYTAKIAKEVGTTPAVYYMNLCLGLIYTVFLIYDPIEWKWEELPNYLGISLGSWVYQLLLVDSSRREPDPAIVALIQSSLIMFTMAIDHYLLGTAVTYVNICGAVIVALTTASAMAEKENKKEAPVEIINSPIIISRSLISPAVQPPNK